MSQGLLDDFKEFLVNYRESWNSCNDEEIIKHSSEELKTRWADSEVLVSDWGYKEAKVGWKQAFTSYKGRDPEWHFEDIVTEINSKQEGIAVFWVRFKMDGSFLNIKKLFVETFRKENGPASKTYSFLRGFPRSDYYSCIGEGKHFYNKK
jgi:hypothetical protein